MTSSPRLNAPRYDTGVDFHISRSRVDDPATRLLQGHAHLSNAHGAGGAEVGCKFICHLQQVCCGFARAVASKGKHLAIERCVHRPRPPAKIEKPVSTPGAKTRFRAAI